MKITLDDIIDYISDRLDIEYTKIENYVNDNFTEDELNLFGKSIEEISSNIIDIIKVEIENEETELQKCL